MWGRALRAFSHTGARQFDLKALEPPERPAAELKRPEARNKRSGRV